MNYIREELERKRESLRQQVQQQAGRQASRQKYTNNKLSDLRQTSKQRRRRVKEQRSTHSGRETKNNNNFESFSLFSLFLNYNRFFSCAAHPQHTPSLTHSLYSLLSSFLPKKQIYIKLPSLCMNLKVECREPTEG